MNAPLLETAGLVKRYGGLTATDHVSLAVRRGETHAVIGPNGAGKTTLLAQLAGALAPDAGTIRFDGRDITRLGPHQRAAIGFARSFQITSILPTYTVLENVAVAVQARSGSSFRFWQPMREERALFDAARSVLREVGIEALADRVARDLAHGEHRQIEIALALATRPRLLLLDEPMAGMGPDESARMVALLERVKREHTIVLVEHDMDAVFRLADRISVMVAGRIVATGSGDEIRANNEVRSAYLGEDEVEG